MKKIWIFLFIVFITIFFFNTIFAENDVISYKNSWGKSGFSLISQDVGSVKINFSVEKFSFQEVETDAGVLQKIMLPGTFLPNNEGAPDLPAKSRFMAIPGNSEIEYQISAKRIERLENIDLAPAPKIPIDTEDGPLQYEKDAKIFQNNAYYPANPIEISAPKKIRGLDVIQIGITPFQYNPITKTLLIYRDVSLQIDIIGGNGHYGDDRLRSRWWDPIQKDLILNPEVIPEHDYTDLSSRESGCEYLIICPDDPDFVNWADSIKTFRTQQGITTEIVTISDIGFNTVNSIENYIDNAYNNWDEPPAAVLLLGDYGSTGNTIISSTISHPYSGTCISDNTFADVDGDDLPDIVFARITARNASELETMIQKFRDYEKNPPTAPNFYDNPITACGWQTERWFQICSEAVGGFWNHSLGKNQVRINEIYSGTPGSIWSTATNTNTVVNYFGPNGLDYIPSAPSTLGGWTGGSAADVVNAINSGAFMLQHRDHGGVTGWGEPSFGSSNLSSLTNADLPFVFSINCLTGKFNTSGECFTEAMHRMQNGALGLIAASEVSYSFVNDTFTWGMYDNMWPQFMPDYGTNPSSRGVLPAFGNVAGKYFLQSSGWPYNYYSKEITYYLFHHHGDAFSSVYTEIPQNLTVSHNSSLLGGATSFDVEADNGSLIALTVDDQIIGVADGTGSPVSIPIPAQTQDNTMLVTVTKQNYYRYSEQVPIDSGTGPYIDIDSYVIDDNSGNGNGIADYGENILLDITLENIGSSIANNVTATVSSSDSYVTISDNSQNFGNIGAGATSTQNSAFQIEISNSVPDQHAINFVMNISSTSDESWTANFSIVVNAPQLNVGSLSILDPDGNNNGILDPGETVNLIIENQNNGAADSPAAIGSLTCSNSNVTIYNSTYNIGTISDNSSENAVFSVTAESSISNGTTVDFDYSVIANYYSAQKTFTETVGQIPILIIDMDDNASSGPIIETTINNLGIACNYSTSFPTNLNLYSSVFVCLGIYSSNHVLSSSQGQTLADYLNNGGSLYMEGGDTWYWDTQTAVQSMFGINAISDGSSDMGTILGQTGSFVEEMTFNYSGENNWMDHIDPVGDAIQIFQNQSPSYGCAVAYNEGNYKTIGTSFEFGGLAEGTSPSTKSDLMQEYLIFFGVMNYPAPNPPTNLEIIASGNDIQLNWTESEQANTYYIYRSTYPNEGFTQIGSTSQTSYTDTDVATSVEQYFYYITADFVAENINNLNMNEN